MTNELWTLEITPKKGWISFDPRDLWRYRDLILLLVWRDFVAFYKQTVLGPAWYILQPLLTTFVFTVVFGKIAGISTEGAPQFLFYLAGVVPWSYFANCVSRTSDTFASNAGIFGKVYFPRLVIPIATILTNLISLSIQLALFLLLLIFYLLTSSSVSLTSSAIVLPLLVLQMAILGLGVGLVVSSLTTKYRDLNFLVGFGLQLWMYASPVVYPLSQVPEKWRWVFTLNPMTQVIEGVRNGFLGIGRIDPTQLAFGWLVTILLLTFGLILFARVEKDFMDTV